MKESLTIRYKRSRLIFPVVMLIGFLLFGFFAGRRGLWRPLGSGVWMASFASVLIGVAWNAVFPSILLRISSDGLYLGSGEPVPFDDIKNYYITQRVIGTGRKRRRVQILNLTMLEHVHITPPAPWKKTEAIDVVNHFIETTQLSVPVHRLTDALRQAGLTPAVTSISDAGHRTR